VLITTKINKQHKNLKNFTINVTYMTVYGNIKTQTPLDSTLMTYNNNNNNNNIY